MQSREAGLRGEQAAAEWLIANGFELLHRNWRSGRYELDIVALREGVLHVVEVKCRRSGALSPPEEAMTPRKFAALMRAAEHYVALYGFDTDTVVRPAFRSGADPERFPALGENSGSGGLLSPECGGLAGRQFSGRNVSRYG